MKLWEKIKKYFLSFFYKNFDLKLFKIADSRSISNTGNENSMKNCTNDRLFVDRQFLWADIRIFTIVFISVQRLYVITATKLKYGIILTITMLHFVLSRMKIYQSEHLAQILLTILEVKTFIYSWKILVKAQGLSFEANKILKLANLISIIESKLIKLNFFTLKW